GAHGAGVGEGRGHPVVLEAPGRVHALVVQVQPPGVRPDVLADGLCPLSKRLALADREDLVVPGKREQLAKPPDPAELERRGPASPLGLEFLEAPRRPGPVPIVDDVHQTAALPTLERRVVERGRGATVGVDAALEGDLGHAVTLGEPARRGRATRAHGRVNGTAWISRVRLDGWECSGGAHSSESAAARGLARPMLNADGSLGPATRTVTLRKGEGAILVRA